MLGMAFVGIVPNLLDLSAGTHFTTDPAIGLTLSALAGPYCIGLYLLARRLGSRRDQSLLAFLEQTLAAIPLS
jgi:hypothetical protein